MKEDTIKVEHGNCKMIAHRGLSGIEMENSMASFIAAGQHTFYGMETDIHPTTDGVFVIIHDSDPARVSGVTGKVEEMTFEQTQEIKLYAHGTTEPRSYLRIPRFEDYLECCIRYEKQAIIEFKENFTPENVKKVLDIVDSYHYMEHCTFISFWPKNLIYVRRYNKNADIQFLSSKLNWFRVQMCAMFKFDMDLCHTLITDETIIPKLHKKGIKVNLWTVNKKEDADKYIAWGVDFITSNILE